MGSIFNGRRMPSPARVANAAHTHQTTASVGFHWPLWVTMWVQTSFPNTKNIST